MAPLLRPIFYLLLALLCFLTCNSLVEPSRTQVPTNEVHFRLSSSRKLLGLQQQQQQQQDDALDLSIEKKKMSSLGTLSKKNQTKLIKLDDGSTKNQTKAIKLNGSTKNQTKLLNLTTSKNKTKLIKPTTNSTNKTKLNSTSKPSSNSAKPISLKSKPNDPADEIPMTQNPIKPIWADQEMWDVDDLISEFREFKDLPSRFQETLLPDLAKISTTSKVYIKKANKEITNGFKPIVGKKYAPLIASIVSCAFILIPLILVSFIFNRIKAYFSLQKLLIFVQIYLYIYFFILSLTGLVTGLEPLRFFYATSPTIYICIQVLQLVAYVVYLVVLVMYCILVFSMDTGLGLKLLSVGQTFVGFAVGLHYYLTVFHRALLHQLPKTSWKVHAVYATCFFVIYLLDRAERRKKAYLEDDGSEGKKS